MTGGQHSDQPAPDAAPPKCRIYSQIQQLAFVLGHAARNGESGDAPRAHRHQQVVLQVLRYVPLRRLRRCGLNLSNRSQIVPGAGPQVHLQSKAQTEPRYSNRTSPCAVRTNSAGHLPLLHPPRCPPPPPPFPPTPPPAPPAPPPNPPPPRGGGVVGKNWCVRRRAR